MRISIQQSNLRQTQWRIQNFPEKGAVTIKVGVANYYFAQFFPKTA